MSTGEQTIRWIEQSRAAELMGVTAAELIRRCDEAGALVVELKNRTLIDARFVAAETGNTALLDEEPSKARGSWIYFIRCHDYVKIGKATSVEDRFVTLQIGCPYELTLLGAIPGGLREERNYHAIFCESRYRGEWFRITPEVVEGLRTLGIVVEPTEASDG
jgi:hypothetical protein